MDLFKDANGKLSAKRIFGGVGLALTILVGLSILVISVFPGNQIDPNAIGIIASIGGFCSALIGFGTFERKQ